MRVARPSSAPGLFAGSGSAPLRSAIAGEGRQLAGRDRAGPGGDDGTVDEGVHLGALELQHGLTAGVLSADQERLLGDLNEAVGADGALDLQRLRAEVRSGVLGKLVGQALRGALGD